MKRYEYSNLDYTITGLIDAESREEARQKLAKEYNSFNSSWRLIQK